MPYACRRRPFSQSSLYAAVVSSSLAEGLYEHLLTRALGAAVERSQPLQRAIANVDPADGPLVLTRHLAREVERALAAIPQDDDRLDRQARVVDALLLRLRELVPEAECSEDAEVLQPVRRLEALFRAAPPIRPSTPLSSTTLLTRTRAEPALGLELAREIASADRIDALIAFITVGGVRAIRDALEQFSLRGEGRRMRVLTTTFTGTTEVAALDFLARLPGVEVRVSYNTQRSRLHAKAWLFRRASGLHTAYVGSANLTHTALGAGQEWMVKVCAADVAHVIDKFDGTFESLWNDPEFEPYDPASEADRKRLTAALSRDAAESHPRVLFALRPYPFQEEILDRLAADRSLHGRRRNLVVAATGTGKTVIAAFDYLREATRAGVRPRLLFIAHRRELLEQARETFRHVLGDHSFGELLGDRETPQHWDYVFATIQSASTTIVPRLGAEHYRYVVVDECHHLPARSYQELVTNLRPDLLLGLTATPERADGKSLLPDFDNHIAAELRLWHALDRQLLVPFEYFGIADNTDLTRLRWARGGYAADDLEGVYTGNDVRVDMIVTQLQRRVSDVSRIHALAFCVSVKHAEYMAEALTARGVPAIAVHGDSPAQVRDSARSRLERREVNVVCTCDLYNEGVDLPFVDVLLLLRPTASATVFMQQIGRGLRTHRDKSSCLILDFIGQHRTEFRFDGLYAALTGLRRSALRQAAASGFPYLPSGCTLQLDEVARERVLSSLQASVAGARRLIEELRELSQEGGELTLGKYLDATGRDVEDVYSAGGWTTLRSRAGLCPAVSDEASELSKRLGSLVHVDEPTRLRVWRDAVVNAANDSGVAFSPYERRRLAMLAFQLRRHGIVRVAEETARELAQYTEVRREVSELFDVLEDRVDLPNASTRSPSGRSRFTASIHAERSPPRSASSPPARRA